MSVNILNIKRVAESSGRKQSYELVMRVRSQVTVIFPGSELNSCWHFKLIEAQRVHNNLSIHSGYELFLNRNTKWCFPS